ncbi:MAG: MFS transporter [Chloroflexi bacterium]|jgi:MFS family permease|nr:MFS transporter [Chloroflexota bacterium]MBT5626889.1 MFS transporter [Chloroflexota bacterium]
MPEVEVTDKETQTDSPQDSGGIGFVDSLRNSSLQRFVSATLAWGTAHQLTNVAQGYLLFELTGSTLWLAALGAAVGLPNIVVGVFGGVLADRIPRTRMLKIGSVIAGAPMLVIAALYATDSLEPWHIVIAGGFQGSGLAIDWISRLSLLPDVVPKKILVRAISLDQSVFNGARVAGPLIGGFLLGAAGPGIAYGVIAGLFGSAFLIYTTFGPVKQPERPKSAGIVPDLIEVVRVIKERPILRLNLMFTAVNALALGGLVFILPAYAKDIFNTDEAGLGLLFAGVGIGAVAGAMTMSWTGGVRRAGPALLITDLLFGAFVIAWAHTNSMSMALPFAFLLGYFNSVHVALGIAVIQFNVPAEVRGRVIGAYEIAWSGFPLGGLASGSLAAAFGLRTALTSLAIGLIVFTIFIAVVSPKFRASRIE